MNHDREPRSKSVRRYTRRRGVILPTLLVWCFSSALTIAAWMHLQKNTDAQAERLVEISADHAALRLEDFIESRELALWSLAQAYSRGRAIEQEGFERSSSIIHENFDGMLAINWINAESRITWVTPREANKAALGKNILDHKEAATYFIKAKQTGQLVATEPVELFQGGTGFAFYIPVMRGDTFLGAINGVFRASAMTEMALRDQFIEDFHIRLLDGEKVLWTSDQAEFSSLRASATFEIIGRRWSLELSPKARLLQAMYPSHWLLLCLGIMCSFLLAGIFYFVIERQRQRIAHIEMRREQERHVAKARQSEAIGQLARGLTHDFNNLLGVINANAELLAEEDTLDEEALESVEAILSSSARACELTRQLLDFSKPESSKIEQGLDVSAFVQRWESFLRGLVPSRIKLILSQGDGLPEVAITDTSLARVITNLLINAIDAIEERGEIEIRWSHQENLVVLAVRDTGVGMSEEISSRIFEPYFTTKEDRGTGLGLSSSYGQLQSVGAEIEVASAPGKGTTFTIKLRVFGATS